MHFGCLWWWDALTAADDEEMDIETIISVSIRSAVFASMFPQSKTRAG
jgi:hypothetical protein